MERDPQGGSDVGRDYERDLGDEVGTAIRDSAPDYLAPIVRTALRGLYRWTLCTNARSR